MGRSGSLYVGLHVRREVFEVTKPIFLGALALLSNGCLGAVVSQAVKRASYDLDCSAEQIELVTLPGPTYGARGCGKQATYVQTCDESACVWVLNSDVTPLYPRNAALKADFRGP
jgi:hypothetical protein